MNDRQKLIFRQIQLAGLGVIVALFGIMNHKMNITLVGLFILLLGLIRMVLMIKLVKKIEEEE